MAMTGTIPSGRESAREILVWDPLVRFIHWMVASAVLVNSIVGDGEALHQWVGYAVLGLVGIRLLWGVIGTPNARFSAFPPSPARALNHLRAMLRGNRSVHLSHNPLGALMVYNIWATIVVLGVTGYMMGTLQFFGVDWVEEAHEIAYGWLITSVVLHVSGVLFDTWRTRVPLLPAMITGRKRIPSEARIE